MDNPDKTRDLRDLREIREIREIRELQKLVLDDTSKDSLERRIHLHSSVLHDACLKSDRKQDAIDFLRSQATEKKNPFAQTCLGILHLNGWTVPRDLGEAEKWFETASLHGDPIGQVNLATMLWGRNLPAAENLFLRAGNNGHTDAFWQLGSFYYYQQPQSLVQAKHYFQMGADKGDACCQYYLASLLNGEPDRALEYFKLAALGGHFRSLQSLDTYYAHECWKSKRERFNFLMEAKRTSEKKPYLLEFGAGVKYKLGILHLRGEYVEQNHFLAYQYLWQGKKYSIVEATRLFDELEEKFDLPTIELSLPLQRKPGRKRSDFIVQSHQDD